MSTAITDLQAEVTALHAFVATVPASLATLLAANSAGDNDAVEAAANQIKADLATMSAAVSPAPAAATGVVPAPAAS